MCVAVCGGYLTGPAGSFSYPNTPGHDEYDHEVSCAWVIHTDANKVCSCSSQIEILDKKTFFCLFCSVLFRIFMIWVCEVVVNMVVQ